MKLPPADAAGGMNGHPQQAHDGEGLNGQCAADKRRILVTEMPSDAVTIGSALFKVAPRNVIVLPVLFENQVKAGIELASVTAFTTRQTTFLERLTTSLGIVLTPIRPSMHPHALVHPS